MDRYELAKEEIAQIDEKLEQLRARKEALLRFIELGNSLFNDAPKRAFVDTRTVSIEEPRARIKVVKASPFLLRKDRNANRHSPMQDQVIRCALDLIEVAGSAHTRDIVEYALMQGVNITGTDHQTKVMTVSAILSKSDKFQADRSKGWTLKEESKNP